MVEQSPIFQKGVASSDSLLKIAIPIAGGSLCPHFGHCEQFAIAVVDPQTRTIQQLTYQTPPPHQPGILPEWLRQQGVHVVIVGGIGQRAVAFLQQSGIQVIIGAPSNPPEQIVQDYLAGTLQTGSNLCDH